jgi:hypothetical protein
MVQEGLHLVYFVGKAHLRLLAHPVSILYHDIFFLTLKLEQLEPLVQQLALVVQRL